MALNIKKMFPGLKGVTDFALSFRVDGGEVTISPNTSGVDGIIARFPSGTKWAVQVRRPGDKPEPFPEKLANGGATRVVAEVASDGGVKYFSARTGRPIAPPKQHAR